jgi:hypothetical protein
MSRAVRLCVLPCLLLATAVSAGAATPSPTASAARSCQPPDYPGSGYFTSLRTRNTSCRKGRRVALAHYNCRTDNGGRKGKCPRRVKGFRCRERRTSIPTEMNSRVTCRDGTKRVKFTYQQNT